MSGTPIYSGIPATADVVPVHSNIHNHHITIAFRPDADTHAGIPYGGTVAWVAVGRVITADVDAIIITHTHGCISDSDIASGVPHITISTADGVSPSASIAAIRIAIRNGTVIPMTVNGHHPVSGVGVVKAFS
jgi:hypothetical protein